MRVHRVPSLSFARLSGLNRVLPYYMKGKKGSAIND